MLRDSLSKLVFLICVSLPAWAIPARDPAIVLRESQRSPEKKQLWLTPNPKEEFAGDFIARLRKKAAAADPAAQATLGLCYQLGLGVKRDIGKAAEWYRKAAAAGHPGAQNNLGIFHDEGIGIAREPAKALELYRTAAKANCPDAMFNVGVDYAAGTVVKQDWAEAAAWYGKAADQGHLPAMNNLGNIYLLGRGVPVDLEKAKQYLRPPAEAGIAVSQFGLGAALAAEGKFELAAAQFRVSAEGGYPGGHFFWAAALLEGRGVPHDAKEALKWARLAAEKVAAVLPDKTAEAQAMVAQILLEEHPDIPPDSKEAGRRARQSAEQGNARGQHLLGVCYHRGAGVERDLDIAIRWYKLAAEQKYPESAWTLGALFESGNGVRRDFSEAVKWYVVAANVGHPVAQYRLGLCYRDGLGVESELSKAAFWLRLAAARISDRQAHSDLDAVERQLAAQPGEAAFHRGLAHAQKAEKGTGEWKDAIEQFRVAANSGHRYATAILAGMMRRGQGTDPDDAAAEALIGKVEKTTDPDLLHYISMSYIVPGDKIPDNHAERALDFLRRAAQQGHPRAQNTLGFQLMSGAGGGPDLADAFKWLTLAARQGDANAQVNLRRLRPHLTDAQAEEGNRRAESFRPRLE